MKRIRNYGIIIGEGRTGKLNKITDVKGVTVGHYTISNENNNTGLTVIMPSADDIYTNKIIAATHTINGYGKTMGLTQIEELGCIETPIFLTNTLNVGKIHDAVIEYKIEKYKKQNINITSLNPIIGECNDYPLNNIQNRVLDKKAVEEAIKNAKIDFEEGDVGAGKGTSCLGLKGGIGSSSRLTLVDGKIYTIGVLVQTNFGGSRDLIIDGNHIGNQINEKVQNIEIGKGSIMIIVATDLPVNERQLKRIIKRTEVGLVKTGSYIDHFSGDVVIGFTTVNRLNENTNGNFRTVQTINEEKLNYVFKMVAEATEEAILNSLATARTLIGYNGKTKYSLTDIYLKNKEANKKYHALINNIIAVNQFPDYPVGCEEVAIYILLKHYNVDVSIEDIVNNLDKGPRPYTENNIIYGGDPEQEFVGDPRDVYSYGVYDKPIEKVANKFKPNIKNITGTSLDEILKLVKQGHPVQVWVSIKLMPSRISKTWIHKETNKIIEWKSNLHSLILIGYTDETVVVSDPDVGAIREFDKQKFEEMYNHFGKRALYYES